MAGKNTAVFGIYHSATQAEQAVNRLLAAGYVEDSLERADVAILNTCVVRQTSEERVYSKLHELRAWKTPERTIAVTGCIVAKEGDVLRKRFPQLDAVVPIGDYEDFVAALDKRLFDQIRDHQLVFRYQNLEQWDSSFANA